MSPAKLVALPNRTEEIRDLAKRAIAPVRPADSRSEAPDKFLFTAERTDGGRDLPPYYLVYFLLVDLLKFRDLGQSEKVAWSVPIDFNGTAYLIEHRKMGLGIFARDAKAEEPNAKAIALLIKRGVKVAEPFFQSLAEKAVRESKINVTNNGDWLFERYEYLRGQHTSVVAEACARKDEREVTRKDLKGGTYTSVHFPALQLERNAKWLALATIDAFFSWTEHIFIHLAILQGRVTSGDEVAALAEAEWQTKFKRAFDLHDPMTKKLFDDLVLIRRQQRNYIAHGAFGKDGEAFSFHSGAGAVPVMLTHRPSQGRFSLRRAIGVDESAALATIDQFITHLWSGARAPAKLYIQDSELPLVLTYARDGTYSSAMNSVQDMSDFVYYLTQQFDNAANMDW